MEDFPRVVNVSEAFSSVHGDGQVELIESTGHGLWRRNIVTEALFKSYISNDYSDDPLATKPGKDADNPKSDTVKLFFSMRTGAHSRTMLPIPMTQPLFEHIRPFARIPEPYLSFLHDRYAMQVFATPQLPPNLSNNEPKNVREEYLSFVIQSVPGAVASICMSTSFTYHLPSRTMYIFMHALEAKMCSDFIDRLCSGVAISTPLTIPSHIVRCNLVGRTLIIENWHLSIKKFERTLGIRWDTADNADRTALDYSSLSRDINAAATNLAFAIYVSRTTTRQLDFLDGVIERYYVLALSNGHPANEVEDNKHMLLQTHQHLRSLNRSIEERAEYLLKRVQALSQTLYSGIAQRDSANSLNLASTSKDLAETSQEVAIATSRDSAVMRLIAAITIFFLPATFTATFFSTTFFNFQVGEDDPVYSWWLWLYFLVTIILSAVVVMGTFFLWRSKEREIATRFAKRKAE